MWVLGVHERVLGKLFPEVFCTNTAKGSQSQTLFAEKFQRGKVDGVLFQLKYFKSALLFGFIFCSETESHFTLN